MGSEVHYLGCKFAVGSEVYQLGSEVHQLGSEVCHVCINLHVRSEVCPLGNEAQFLSSEVHFIIDIYLDNEVIFLLTSFTK